MILSEDSKIAKVLLCAVIITTGFIFPFQSRVLNEKRIRRQMKRKGKCRKQEKKETTREEHEGEEGGGREGGEEENQNQNNHDD